MANGNLVPATALSRYDQASVLTQLTIGTQNYMPPGNPPTPT